MAESLVHTFLGLFDGLRSIPFGKELIVFLISLMPILELRGGLIAAALLGLNIVPAFIICLIGNLLPIPFILWFITPIFKKLKKTKHLSKIVNKIEKKALSKKDKIEKAEFWGLFFFVGIPLPGTGGWTGSLIASLIDMDKKKAMLAITCGVLLAGLIVGSLSFGLLKGIVG